MKSNKAVYFLFIIIVISSCSSNKYFFRDSSILKKDQKYVSERNLVKIKKEPTNVIVDSDTIGETQYKFFIPKNSKSYESVVNSIPSIHIFSYPKDQYLIVLKTNKQTGNSLLNIDRESFLSAVEKVGNIYHIEEDIEMLKNRKYDILIKNDITYIIINKKDKNLFEGLINK